MRLATSKFLGYPIFGQSHPGVNVSVFFIVSDSFHTVTETLSIFRSMISCRTATRPKNEQRNDGNKSLRCGMIRSTDQKNQWITLVDVLLHRDSAEISFIGA